MFGLLARFYQREDTYRPTERAIYSYWNGLRMVHADPMALHRTMMANWADISIPIKVGLSQSKDAKQAQADAAAKIREVFQIAPLTNTFEVKDTLTDTQVFALLNSFLGYCNGVKKNSPTSQTTSMPTADSKPTSEVVVPATTSTSASGSTDGVSSTAVPVPSNSESPTPSV